MPYHEHAMFTRGLTNEERAFLAAYFGPSLAVSRISLSAARGLRSWSPYGSHIRISHTLLGPDREVKLEAPRAASVFAHEALHVWQRQHGRAVSRQGALLQSLYTLKLHNPYAYDRSIVDPEQLLTFFLRANIEQQGQIFQDYVYAERTGKSAERFVGVASFVRARTRP